MENPIPLPCSERIIQMKNSQYNQNRYNRKKQWYRIRLGAEQFFNYPVLNLIWLLFAIGIVFWAIGGKKMMASFDVQPFLEPIFISSMMFLLIFFPIICLAGILQFVGDITARKDDGNICLVFGNRRDTEQQVPILISKKKIKTKNVIVREFYTTIPMERWQEKREDIADIFNVSIIGEIEYGGKYDGNKIRLRTVRGRKIIKKDVLYDDMF